MQIALIILQYSVLIPFIVGIIKFKELSDFLRVIFYLTILSFLTEIFASLSINLYGKNLIVYQIYSIINPIIMYWAWSKMKSYNLIDNRRSILFVIAGIVILFRTIYFNPTVNNFIIYHLVNVFIMLLLGVQYYIAKVLKTNISETLHESPFIVASAFILYALSIIIILSSFPFVSDDTASKIWFVKQLFYLIFNLLISYSFHLNKS